MHCLSLLQSVKHCWLNTYYPDMLIGKVWIYQLLFFVCVFVWLRASLARIKLAASNFAQWFISVLGRESPILGDFALPEAQNQTNQPPPGSIT